MMTRNTEKRVEVACPVYDDRIKAQLTRMLQVMLADNVKARILQSDGNYKKKEQGNTKVCAQEYFMKEAMAVKHPKVEEKLSFGQKLRKLLFKK